MFKLFISEVEFVLKSKTIIVCFLFLDLKLNTKEGATNEKIYKKNSRKTVKLEMKKMRKAIESIKFIYKDEINDKSKTNITPLHFLSRYPFLYP